MPDIFVVVLVVLGVALVGAGVVLLVGRRRVAKNMEAAGVVPSRVGSSVTYVVVLGVGQVALGALSLVAAGVMAKRDAFGHFYRAVDQILQLGGLNGGFVGTVALLLGLVAVTAGLLVFRRAWRSRGEWDGTPRTVRLPPEAHWRISAGTVLCALGGIASVFGGILLASQLVS